MTSFISPLYNFFASCFSWIHAVSNLIRTTPFLLFTIGFVAIGYAIAVLGRILNHE